MNYSKAFTLIELMIVIVITAILSGIVLLNVSGYVNKGKDSNVYGTLSTLIPAGEVFYSGNNSSYVGFCASAVVANVISQMPSNPNANCSGNTVCCNEVAGAWAACVKEFVNSSYAYCVDSRGTETSTTLSAASCNASVTACP